MATKEIIKISSKRSKKPFWIILLVLLFISIIGTCIASANDIEWYCEMCNKFESNEYCSICYGSFLTLWFEQFPIGFIGINVILVSLFETLIAFPPIELTVTNKRVYGKTAFGKRVDLPLDSISSISIIDIFEGVTIATSSGNISFSFITNHKEIYNVVSKLLVERQNNKLGKVTDEKSDYIEDLKRLKELLDEGIIIQEEFDKKKNELLK